MRISLQIFICSVIFLSSACSRDNKQEASECLQEARLLYQSGEYVKAKNRIDSLKILYPKAFDEIKASFALLDSVRRAQNVEVIKACDSLIEINRQSLEMQKKYFVYQFDKQYDQQGTYIPRESYQRGPISNTTLRSGVTEDGKMYIESIFIGNNTKHTKLRIVAGDGTSAETLPETGDGLNYKAKNLDKQYEIIKYIETTENGVSKFITANASKKLTASLEGKTKNSYTLVQAAKDGISKSYNLSVTIKTLDSLLIEKDKALFNIEYLVKKGQKGGRMNQ